MKPIFVIGSNSFSGSSFISFLLRNGLSVVGISRSPEPINSLCPYKWIDNSNFRFHQLDLNKNLDEIIKLISNNKAETIINFAAQSMVGESWDYPEHWFNTNVVSSINLHNKLRQIDHLSKYVHVTTPEVYGSCEGFVSESQPFNPSTPYAVSRAAADMSLKTYFDTFDFPVLSTRAANVYGEGQSLYRLIPKTIMTILKREKLTLHGGGTSSRSFIHIDDVSDATWKILNNGRIGDTFHISTTKIVQIKELVKMVCEMMDVKFEDYVLLGEERLGKDAAYLLNSEKVRLELSWEDKVGLENGLERTIKWARDNFKELSTASLNYTHKE